MKKRNGYCLLPTKMFDDAIYDIMNEILKWVKTRHMRNVSLVNKHWNKACLKYIERNPLLPKIITAIDSPNKFILYSDDTLEDLYELYLNKHKFTHLIFYSHFHDYDDILQGTTRKNLIETFCILTNYDKTIRLIDDKKDKVDFAYIYNNIVKFDMRCRSCCYNCGIESWRNYRCKICTLEYCRGCDIIKTCFYCKSKLCIFNQNCNRKCSFCKREVCRSCISKSNSLCYVCIKAKKANLI